MTCDVIGNPAPEIQWTFNDGPIDGTRFQISPSGDLLIKQIQDQDAGTYRCTAGNSLGKITAAAQLRVLSKSLSSGPFTFLWYVTLRLITLRYV